MKRNSVKITDKQELGFAPPRLRRLQVECPETPTSFHSSVIDNFVTERFLRLHPDLGRERLGFGNAPVYPKYCCPSEWHST